METDERHYDPRGHVPLLREWAATCRWASLHPGRTVGMEEFGAHVIVCGRPRDWKAGEFFLKCDQWEAIAAIP